MHTRHAILVVCVLACGHAGHSGPPPSSLPAAQSVVLAGPTVPADSLRVAATDAFSVAIAQRLAPGSAVNRVSDRGALDLIDSGADVIVTDRTSVIHYASTRADFTTILLPWDRQYAFVSASAPPIGDMVDAVHADARPASARCPLDSVARQPVPTGVLYPPDDSVARSLAERLVGLGVAKRAVPQIADRMLAESQILVRPIDSASCDVGAWHAVPLIDTRSHLIVRRGSVGVVADTVGGVRLETTP